MTGGSVNRTLILSDLTPEDWHTEEGEETIFAVRLRKLALTAYGRTEEEAQDNIQKILHAFINYLVDKEILEQTLNQVGVSWEWEDAAPKVGWRRANTESGH